MRMAARTGYEAGHSSKPGCHWHKRYGQAGGTVSRDYQLTVDNKRFDAMLQQELDRVSAAFVTRLQQN